MPLVIQTKTNASGFFSAPDGLERQTPDGLALRAINVAAQHTNGAWHALEISNSGDSRFWWRTTRSKA